MTTEAVEAPSSSRGWRNEVASILPSRGWWLTGVLTLFLALWTVVPWRPASVPADAPYVDASWMVVLHLAFVDDLTWGKDIVFTYGPWGFVATRTYVPGTFGWLLFWWIALAASISYAALAVAAATIRSSLWAALWISALVFVVIAGNEAPFIAAAALFVLAAAGIHATRALTAATVVLAALLAWLGLVKFTYFGLGLALVLLVTAYLLVTRRRVGPALPVYALSWVVCWLLAGQPLGAIPPYIVNGLSIVAGYTPAMSLWSADTWIVGLFLAAAAAVVAVVAFVERRAGRRFPVMAAGFAVILFFAYKASFVRQDDSHAAIGLLAISTCAVAIAPLFDPPALHIRERRAATVAVIALALATWHLAATPEPWRQAEDVMHRVDDTLVFFAAPHKAAASRRDGWTTALAEIRAKVPLPRVGGAADLYPDDQLVLVANGIRRFSRPVFQSYSAYTPRLIGLNEAHLRRADRPRTMFVDLEPIDGRWPTSEDGPNLMTILSDYRLDERTGSYLVFRDDRRRGYRLEPVRTVHVRLGESVVVPSLAGGPVWVTMDVRRTVLGRLEELVFRPAVLFLDARLADGRQVQHRLVPGVTTDGFLLSPYLADRNGLAAMTTTDWRQRLAGSAVRTITLRAHGDRFHGYSNDVDVTFSRVTENR